MLTVFTECNLWRDDSNYAMLNGLPTEQLPAMAIITLSEGQ